MCRTYLALLSFALLGIAGISPLSAQETAQEDTPETTAAPAAEPGETPSEDALPESGYRLIQPDHILFTFIEFRNFDHLHQLQEQMLSIPGLTNFIPHLEAPGLLTYQLRYSGTTELLMKALQELFAAQYELGLKQMGEKSWEITMRRSSQAPESSL